MLVTEQVGTLTVWGQVLTYTLLGRVSACQVCFSASAVTLFSANSYIPTACSASGTWRSCSKPACLSLRRITYEVLEIEHSLSERRNMKNNFIIPTNVRSLTCASVEEAQ